MGVGPAWALLVGLLGGLLGPVLRARILHHSVPPEQGWRRDCPQCAVRLVRGVVAVLPPTGRCPACRARIGPAPFTVEVATAVVFAGLALRVADPWVLAAFCFVAAIGVALWYIDVAVFRLPDPLTYPAFVGVLLLLLGTGEFARVGWAALNGLGLAAFYLLLILIYPAGMGLGDAKLALSLGTALGWAGWVVTIFGAAAGFLFSGLFAAVMLVLGRVSRKSRIPHGPFMLLGTLATILLLA